MLVVFYNSRTEDISFLLLKYLCCGSIFVVIVCCSFKIFYLMLVRMYSGNIRYSQDFMFDVSIAKRQHKPISFDIFLPSFLIYFLIVLRIYREIKMKKRRGENNLKLQVLGDKLLWFKKEMDPSIEVVTPKDVLNLIQK